jgi:hypothetical protein
MKKVEKTVYVTDDGKEFNTEKQARWHEKLENLRSALNDEIYWRDTCDDEVLKVVTSWAETNGIEL